MQNPLPQSITFFDKLNIMKTMTCKQLGGTCDKEFNSMPESD